MLIQDSLLFHTVLLTVCRRCKLAFRMTHPPLAGIYLQVAQCIELPQSTRAIDERLQRCLFLWATHSVTRRITGSMIMINQARPSISQSFLERFGKTQTCQKFDIRTTSLETQTVTLLPYHALAPERAAIGAHHLSQAYRSLVLIPSYDLVPLPHGNIGQALCQKDICMGLQTIAHLYYLLRPEGGRGCGVTPLKFPYWAITTP